MIERCGGVFLAALLTGVSVSVAAQPATDYAFVAKQFQDIVAVTQSANTMPRLAVEGIDKLIGELSDQDRFLNDPDYDVDSLGELIGLCSNANQVVMAYELFTINERLVPTEDNAVFAAQVSELMSANIVEYQDELTLLQPFLFRCMEKQIPLLTEYIGTLPPDKITEARIAGLVKARVGSYRTYVGAVLEMGNEELKTEYRLAMIAALAESAEEFASLLTVEQRGEISANAKALSQDNENVQRHLDTIVAAMADQSCTGICEMQLP